VVFESRRRCALCFPLKNDPSVKDGQLAHIDRDRANSAEAKIVFLCPEHHNQYDSKPSQTKGLMPAEIAIAKRRRSAAIKGANPHLARACSAPPRGRPMPLLRSENHPAS
jgi:hypothetical protein